MADSLSEMLRQDTQCKELLECFHGLTRMDKEVFRLLNDVDEPLTVDELAEGIDRERSTAYRSVQRLMTAGLIEKEQVNYDQGGYYHVYHSRDADAITDDMQRMLNDRCAKMGRLVGELNEKYSEELSPTSPVES